MSMARIGGRPPPPSDRVPSENVTLTGPAPSTTCSAVTIVASALTMTPVPVSRTVVEPGSSASIETTDGAAAV